MSRRCSFRAILLFAVCLSLCIAPSVQIYQFWYASDSSINPVGPGFANTVKEVTVCGGLRTKKKLMCDNGKQINVKNALYGRIGNECSDGVALVRLKNQKCKGDRTATMDLVKKRCAGKKSCTLRVRQALRKLSNPCPGTNKYLKVAYDCI